MIKLINIYGVNTVSYKVNPAFVSCVFKDPFDDTTIVLSGGREITTKTTVEEVVKLLKE